MQHGRADGDSVGMIDALLSLFLAPFAVTSAQAAGAYAMPSMPHAPAHAPSSGVIKLTVTEPRIAFADVPRRILAPIVCSPAGLRMFAPPDRRDARVKSIALYSDAPLPLGERVELEVFVNGAEGDRARMTAKVVRVDTLAKGRPAHFDIVFEVTRIDARAADAVVGLLA